jgi:hypothetical protein
MTPSITTPGPGAPPVNSQRGQGMTQSLPLSYWSPEKSYMTSSCTATLIYIPAQLRVKILGRNPIELPPRNRASFTDAIFIRK